jgi:cation diffusion facilitator family transporter
VNGRGVNGTGSLRRNETARFGHTELPEDQQAALRKGIRFQWITIAFLAVAVTLVYLVLGNSQAMKAAWIEDLLSFLPPVAFLVAVRIIRRRPTADHPYGYHRAVGVAHLVSAVALLVMGSFLVVDSGMGLVKAEHPTIGAIQLLGGTFWLGWLMLGAMALTAVPPVYLGRVKMKLAESLHDKVLYADADMNRADWMTAVAAMAGVGGIGLGLWWADYAAALLISVSILRDGVKNMKGAVGALMDMRARTYDESAPHPAGAQVDEYLRSLPWVADAESRVRDEGHVLHIESFVVPEGNRHPSLEDLEKAREGCARLDWKVQDMVLVPVSQLPEEFLPGKAGGAEDRDDRAAGPGGSTP